MKIIYTKKELKQLAEELKVNVIIKKNGKPIAAINLVTLIAFFCDPCE